MNFVVFLLYALANAAYTVALSTIATVVSKVYGVTDTEVNLVYASSAAGYLIFAMPSNWCLENYGVHLTIIISSVFTITGIWIR